jgi:mannobiose 2-epimerase
MNAEAWRDEIRTEWQSILQYWILHIPDRENGGFVGRIDEHDRSVHDAPKGLVLHSRILWTFSSAWRHTGQAICQSMASTAYEYLFTHFVDPVHDGAFWSLDASGSPVDTSKRLYGQAFALYGISEYYNAVGDRAVLDEAIRFYRLIEKYGNDPVHRGYFEAFGRDWTPLGDVRLSDKDANESKSMNTHLHILEAYTSLYRVWRDAGLGDRIRQLLEVFALHIIHSSTAHLGLFFTEDWQPRSNIISYGHDIEAAWLLYEAAVTVGDALWTARISDLALRLADAAAEGLDTDGGLWYEKEGDRLIREKHWWPQAEAMVGFLYAGLISGEERWTLLSARVWSFIKQYIRHPQGQEWYWGIGADQIPMPGQDKAGFWKCPYHNSRACVEIVRLLSRI